MCGQRSVSSAVPCLPCSFDRLFSSCLGVCCVQWVGVQAACPVVFPLFAESDSSSAVSDQNIDHICILIRILSPSPAVLESQIQRDSGLALATIQASSQQSNNVECEKKNRKERRKKEEGAKRADNLTNHTLSKQEQKQEPFTALL